MDKIKFSVLNDVYGQLLTEKQKEIVNLYFSCDLSLAEIAEMKKISRSACLDSIEQAKQHLTKYESVLKVVETKNRIENALAKENSLEELKKEIKEILGD